MRRVIEGQKGRRISRDRLLGAMARRVTSHGDTRSRLRHGVLVHAVDRNDNASLAATPSAYYETERGYLPVHDEAVLSQVESKLQAQVLLSEQRTRSLPAESQDASTRRQCSQQETKPIDAPLDLSFGTEGVQHELIEAAGSTGRRP